MQSYPNGLSDPAWNGRNGDELKRVSFLVCSAMLATGEFTDATGDTNMSRNILGMIRAMLNDNGRTDDEAKAFHAKAAEWTQKYNLHHIFGEEIKAKASKPKGKAKAKTAKPIDTTPRQILVKRDGRWHLFETVRKCELRDALKAHRDAGYTVKSKVVK